MSKTTPVTPGGMSYIKCVTSPNDFAVSRFAGIPDEYDGKVLVKQSTFTGGLLITTPATLNNYYILVPVPGVAYLYGSCVPGAESSMVLTVVPYTDTAQLMPSGAESSVVNGFRFASNAIEIVPTVNQMSWGGAIEVWKTVIEESIYAAGAGTNLTWAGLDALASAKPSSVLPFNHGMYSVSASTNNAFPFCPVRDELPYSNIATAAWTNTWSSAINYAGLGNQETVIVKIPMGSPSTNSALIRTWSCVEYQVNSLSLMWDLAHMSAPYDPVALRLAKEYMQSQPVAVAYYENANFWQNFLKWVTEVSGALRVVPGPVGEVAGIAQLVSKTASMYV